MPRIEHHRRRFRVSWWQSGQRLRRSFDSEEAAQEFLQRLDRERVAATGAGPSRLKGGLTVSEVVDNWYRDHKRNLSSGTQRDYEGRIPTMEYKTLRYPGHVAIMRPIREMGLLALDPVDVKGAKVVPRDASIAAVSPRLTKPNGRDLVALRVEVRGRSGARVAWQLLDYYDEATGISAMMRTTGYSLAITGVMQVDGRSTSAGGHTPDEAVPFQPYVEELKNRGVEIREVSQ